jgi:hypothetical protein
MTEAQLPSEPGQEPLKWPHRYAQENADPEYYLSLGQETDPLKRIATLVRDHAEIEDLQAVLELEDKEDPKGAALDEYIEKISRDDDFPWPFLAETLGAENLLQAAKRLGFARKEYNHRDRGSLAQAISEVLGFQPLRPPYGLNRMIEEVEANKKRCVEQLGINNPDLVIIKGCFAIVFEQLERVLRELLDFYLRWRFKESEGDFELWITDKRCINAWRRDKVTLGQYREIIVNIEGVLERQEEERQVVEESFGRPFLINSRQSQVMESIQELPGERLDYLEDLQIAIERRNASIHWKERGRANALDILRAIEIVHRFLDYLSRAKIFPEIVTILEECKHRLGNYIRIYDEQGQSKTVAYSRISLKLHPAQYYFSQAKQHIFIERKPGFCEVK